MVIGKSGADSSAKISGGTFIPNVGNGACSIGIANGNKLDTVIDQNCRLQKTDGTCIEDLSNLTRVEEQVEVVSASLFFTKQPVIEESQSTVLQGHDLENALKLSVKVAGTAVSSETDVTYQWYVEQTLDGKTGAIKKKLEEANTATYTIPVSSLEAGSYEYYCAVKCGSDEAVSQSVTFTVEKGAVSMYDIYEDKDSVPKHYKTLGEALDEAESAAGTWYLQILQDIKEEKFNNRELNIDGVLSIDLNGYNVGHQENGTWKTDMSDFGIILNGSVGLKNSNKEKEGYLHGTLQVNSGICDIYEDVIYDNLNIYGKGTARLQGGTCNGTVSIGKAEAPYTDDNSGVECSIYKGTYKEVEVCYKAKFTVIESAEIQKLTAKHAAGTEKVRADISLQNGHYGTIQVELLGSTDEEEDLNNKSNKFAIQDMLALNHVFCDSEGEEVEAVPRTTTAATDLTVRSKTITEWNAVVRIEATKEDGTVETTRYASWKAATNYLSDASSAKGQFDTWKSIKIVLLRDARIISNVETWSDCFAHSRPSITVCSENGTHTLTGSGNNLVLGGSYLDVTLKDIKIADGCMEGAAGATFTLEKGVEVSAAPDRGKATMKVSDGELVLNDASVISTTESGGSYAVDLYNTTLRMYGTETKLASAYIDGDSNKRVTLVIDAFSAGEEDGAPVFTAAGEQSDLVIYYTGIHAQFNNALAKYNGNVKVWYLIELEDGAALAEGKNTDTVTTFEGQTYGLYRKNNEKDFVIYVDNNACQYSTYLLYNGGGTWSFGTDSVKSFKMPQSKAKVKAHNWKEDGSCDNSYCNIIDIEKAYNSGALKIEGLEDRTYDSYPQILTKITWTSERGKTEELTAPIYQDNRWNPSDWKR